MQGDYYWFTKTQLSKGTATMERTQQQFGGTWTERKLGCLEKYLNAYMKIMSRNVSAQYLRPHYVDAFAGTGYSTMSEPERGFFDLFADSDTRGYLEGSASRALRVEPPFHRYIFIEKSKAKCGELERLVRTFADRSVDIRNTEANDFLRSWCPRMQHGDRAVVFLDPYGMQVEWSTIEAIADTKAVDLWLLFPLSGVNRVLAKQIAMPPSWKVRLTKFFGTEDWEQAFYAESATPDLFGDLQEKERQVDYERIKQYFIARLKSCFPVVAPKPLLLRNDRGAPLFLFCFAAGNLKGAATALKIANDILKE